MPVPERVRLLDRQASAARQIFAPRQLLLRCPNTRHPWRNAKSAFMPSMAISRRRRAYMDVFTQHLNSIAHWLWLTILDNLGAGFTASCRASDRTLRHQITFICRGDGRAFMNVTLLDCPVSFSTACRFLAYVRALLQCRVA